MVNFHFPLTVIDANGCSSTCDKTITVNELPICSISGPSEVCGVLTNSSFSGPIGMSNYAWSIAGNGNIIGSSNAQNIMVNSTINGSYTLSLVVSDANGCTSSCTKIVPVNALPVCNIVGEDEVCESSTHSFSAPASMTNYTWSITGNGNITSGINDQNITVDASTNGNFTLSLTIIDANGCISSCDKIVTINPLPVCDISGSSEVCQNSTSNSFLAPSGMTNYNWTIVGDGNIVSGSDNQNVIVDATSHGSFTLSLTVIDAKGCTSSCDKSITVNPLPACDIFGEDEICQISDGGLFCSFRYE